MGGVVGNAVRFYHASPPGRKPTPDRFGGLAEGERHVRGGERHGKRLAGEGAVLVRHAVRPFQRAAEELQAVVPPDLVLRGRPEHPRQVGHDAFGQFGQGEELVGGGIPLGRRGRRIIGEEVAGRRQRLPPFPRRGCGGPFFVGGTHPPKIRLLIIHALESAADIPVAVPGREGFRIRDGVRQQNAPVAVDSTGSSSELALGARVEENQPRRSLGIPAFPKPPIRGEEDVPRAALRSEAGNFFPKDPFQHGPEGFSIRRAERLKHFPLAPKHLGFQFEKAARSAPLFALLIAWNGRKRDPSRPFEDKPRRSEQRKENQ